MILYLDDINLGNRPTKYGIRELEPRPNIRSSYKSTAARCVGASSARSVVESWEYQFEVYCLGNGDLLSAQRSKNVIDIKLAGTMPIALVRQVSNEVAQTYTVLWGYTRPILITNQYICDRIIAVELNLHVVEGLRADISSLPSIPELPALTYTDADDPSACYFYFL